MKRLLLLALVFAACASRPIDDGSTDWTVQLGSTSACVGTMTLAPNHVAEPHGQPPALVGSWSCGNYGGQASGDIRPDASVFLNLETTPGFVNGVRGTLVTDDAINGEILIDGKTVPFVAYRQ